jgi:hypothetical protein
MYDMQVNDSQIDVRDMGGGGGHGGADTQSKESRDYGKWALVTTLIVLVAVAVVLWIL